MSWLTADLPGTGGRYKEDANDFQVEEIPLYACSGEGEHLYLWTEKRNTSTREMLYQLARGLSVKEREIGYAGLKDSRALTRQMISVPASCADRLKTLDLDGCRILNTDYHTNKLRLGHLAGNRFTITLRGTKPQAAPLATAILNQLKIIGVPNFFGEQRYGILGNSAKLGELILARRYEEFCFEMLGDPALIHNPGWKQAATLFRQGELKQAKDALPKRMRDERGLIQILLQSGSHKRAVLGLSRNLLRLYLSATQSALFDQLLSQRLHAINQLFDGDIAVKHSNGACFRVDKAEDEQERADLFEISPSAPLYGTKVMLAEDQQGLLERNILDQLGLALEDWKTEVGVKVPGERRALRVPITDISLAETEDMTLTVSFILPKGSYATSVLKEIIK